MTATIHCFEAAGLGKAPFIYEGMVDQIISHGERVIGSIGGCEVTTKPGGTCAYCGTYIVNMFNVRSADGNRFHVGCECIKKTGDEGLIRKVSDDVKKMERTKRQARKQAKLKAARELCESFPLQTFADQPHPSPTFADQGLTLADWARWMLANKHYETLAGLIRSRQSK